MSVPFNALTPAERQFRKDRKQAVSDAREYLLNIVACKVRSYFPYISLSLETKLNLQCLRVCLNGFKDKREFVDRTPFCLHDTRISHDEQFTVCVMFCILLRIECFISIRGRRALVEASKYGFHLTAQLKLLHSVSHNFIESTILTVDPRDYSFNGDVDDAALAYLLSQVDKTTLPVANVLWVLILAYLSDCDIHQHLRHLEDPLLPTCITFFPSNPEYIVNKPSKKRKLS
jgi:hypothetical protein